MRRMLWCWLVLWSLSVSGFGLAAPALAVDDVADYVPLAGHAQVLEDPGGELTLADLAGPDVASRFKPARAEDGQINFGYSASAYWLRIDLARQARGQATWLLEVAFPSLDAIDFYAVRAGKTVHYATGDLLPFAQRPYVHRNFVFPLQLASDRETTVYLRVASQGSLTLPLRLWQPERFRQHSLDMYALLSLYYGMLLALGLYNLLLYTSLRDRVYLYYVAFVASMAVGQLSLNGLGNQYLWPDWPAWGNLALVVGFNATGMFGALFTRRFLETWRQPWGDRLILVLAAGFAVAGLAATFASYRVVAVMTSLLGIVFSVTAVFAAVQGLRRGHHGARLFLLAWLLLLCGVGVMGMRNLAWLPTNLVTTYAMQIGSGLEMLLLSFALADRITAVRRENEVAREQALLARQQELATLLKVEKELESRVEIRTRALADANERLSAQEEMLRHLAHHDALTGLPNRLLLEDRLAQAILKAKRMRSGVAVLWVDLDAFKPVNDSYGHGVGDRVLCQLAERFRSIVRVADTVARLGGDEFVFVLDDLHARADAFGVADKVVLEAARPLLIGEREFCVGASVGVAYWPDDALEPKLLLQQADEAMYAAKAAGRGRWATVSGATPEFA